MYPYNFFSSTCKLFSRGCSFRLDQQRFLKKSFELGGVAGRVKRAPGSTVNHHFPVLVRSLKPNTIVSNVERTFSTCGPIVACTTVDKGKATFHALVLFKDRVRFVLFPFVVFPNCVCECCSHFINFRDVFKSVCVWGGGGRGVCRNSTKVEGFSCLTVQGFVY